MQRSPNVLLEYAHWYAGAGLPVLPCHAVDHRGLCSCGKGQCHSAGKHPRTRQGLRDATCDHNIIRGWWNTWPNANVGIRTDGLLVLDADGPQGASSRADLERQHGQLPPTWEQETGGGGRHHGYRQPEGAGVRNSQGKLGVGLDVRADGGYVVAAPSRHVSGRYYQWVGRTIERPIAVAPDWLVGLAGPSKETNSSSLPEVADELLERASAYLSTLSPAISGHKGHDHTFAAAIALVRGFCLPEREALELLKREYNPRCVPPWDEKDLWHKVQTAARDGRLPRGYLLVPRTSASPAIAAPSQPMWPEPISKAGFHGVAGEVVRAIEPHTEADPAALLVQFLVTFGNIVGRGAHFLAEADRHTTNLFAVLVGRSSKGRKGSSLGHIRRLFEAVDPAWDGACVQSGLTSGEGLIWAVRDPIVKTEPIKEKQRVVEYQPVTVDEGVADKRLLIQEQEFASTLRVLGRDGNTLSALVRQAWDRGDLRTLAKNAPARATGAHISILGHITRDELRRYLDRTEAGNGFANRFLWVCVDRSKVLPEGGRIDQVDFRELHQRLALAIEFGRIGRPLSRSEGARALWCRIYERLSAGRPGMLGAVTGRAEAQVLRLSVIYALLDQSKVVETPHLEAALAVWRYAAHSAAYVFGSSVGDPVADRILSELRNSATGLTRTNLRDAFGRNSSAAKIERGLALLAECGLAHGVAERTGGRPAERWYAVVDDTTETTEVGFGRVHRLHAHDNLSPPGSR